MSPKRSLFSLNLDSNVQHVSSHNPEGIDGVKVFDTKNTRGIEKSFGNLVNRTVDGVLEESGKKVTSVDGELHTSSSKTTSRSGSSTLNIKNSSKRRSLEEKYDTSEL